MLCSLERFNFENPVLPNSLRLDSLMDEQVQGPARFCHLFRKQEMNRVLKDEVIDLFKERYGFEDRAHFLKVWDRLGAPALSPKAPLTVGILRKIDYVFKHHFIYHGAGISPPPLNEEDNADPAVKALMNALLHGAPFSRDMINLEVIKTVFVDHTHNHSRLTTAFFEELKKELAHLATQLPPYDEPEAALWSAFFGNLISLLPFCYPEAGSVLSIPILKKEGDGTYSITLMDYTIETIDLAFNGMSSPMKALGLTSLHPDALPMLSYIGTTYPGGDGFAATLLADFTPGHSVGELVYQRNREAIDRWLSDKQKVHVFGMSLGGAMALHTLHDYHEKLARIDVYNPPGLYPGQWRNELSQDCSINIWCQAGDLVGNLGVWPEDSHVSLYLLIPGEAGLAKGPSAHARVFSGCRNVTILKLDPEVENDRTGRFCLTYLHKIASWFVYAGLMACVWMSYVILAIARRCGLIA